jgi:hypothetical protein
LWLNIQLSDGTGINDFLFEIADHNIERAAGEQVRGGIVVARLGKLPVSGCPGEVSQR